MTDPTFSDSELKRLKDDLQKHIVIDLVQDNGLALLARLEAAEKLCDHDTDDCENEHQGCHRCRLTKAWRKAAGK